MAWKRNTRAVDEVVGALRDARRRHALYYLRERETVDVEELARVLTGWDAVGEGDGTADRGDYEQVRARLHHSDLPKLADAGLVSLDRDAGTVAADTSGLADDLLDSLLEHERLPAEEGSTEPPTGSEDVA